VNDEPRVELIGRKRTAGSPKRWSGLRYAVKRQAKGDHQPSGGFEKLSAVEFEIHKITSRHRPVYFSRCYETVVFLQPSDAFQKFTEDHGIRWLTSRFVVRRGVISSLVRQMTNRRQPAASR